jgi:formylmethanofuran dehydrogenase subunit C
MALVLTQQVETNIPIEVDGITPKKLAALSDHEIAKRLIYHGRNEIELGELFQISGSLSDDLAITFQGELHSVHGIGTGMTDGTIRIESTAGRRVGSQMTGGTIKATSSVGDFCGIEMKGGSISVDGDAGDMLGGHYPGSKFGMNRGEIIVKGSAGSGVGQGMRRGTIVVGGNCGELAGWNMLAGTIMVFGECGKYPGAEMKRGTIVLMGEPDPELLPTFVGGGTNQVPILSMLKHWLSTRSEHFSADCLTEPFEMFHGDMLQGGRGELFVRRSR